MMTPAEMQRLVRDCTYKPGWKIDLHDDGRPYLQLEATTLCSISHQPTTWKSGKRYLSPHMCRQEVVGAVFALIKDAEMHEVHEWFRYRGASIYNPHLDPDALADLAKRRENFVMRDNPMSMDENTP